MQCRKWPFLLTQSKIARVRTLWVQAAALTYLEVRPPQQGQVFSDPAHMQTGQGCRRQAKFIVSNCCKECQDQKTKLKWCRCLKNMVSKEIQSEVPSQDNEEGGNYPQSCSINAKQSRVRQGLSKYNPFLQIQKYQSETIGKLTEQCRMRCQESVDNTWLSTSFTL